MGDYSLQLEDPFRFHIVHFFQKIMKIKIAVLFLTLITACSNPKDNKVKNEAVLTAPEELSPNTKKILSKIIGKEGGVIRGFEIGDPISKIQDEENLEQFENENNRLGYTFDTHDMETVDIQYLYSEDELLEEIQIDVYMNSDEANQDMLRAFSTYFNNRFGTAAIHIGEPTWETEDVLVKIKIVKTKLDRGLNISFTKA